MSTVNGLTMDEVIAIIDQHERNLAGARAAAGKQRPIDVSHLSPYERLEYAIAHPEHRYSPSSAVAAEFQEATTPEFKSYQMLDKAVAAQHSTMQGVEGRYAQK